MVSIRCTYELFILLALLIAVPLEAVTVPLCPTNKIAPLRRQIQNWDYKARTFGAFYDLLAPNNQYQNDVNDAPSDLQETPDDDPDDCGEIEDYDENDLSSITQQVQRRQGRDKLFGWFRPPSYPVRPPSAFPPPERPPYRPERPPVRPERPPQRPERPPISNFPATRPPYWSGGFFGSNNFRPPLYQDPTDNIKPIYENSEHFQQPYQPSVVGGPSGHIIGASPAIPNMDNYETTTRTPFFPNRTPRYEPERTPRYEPERTPRYEPERTPRYEPERTPRYEPERTPRYEPERTPRYEPERTPRYDPVRTTRPYPTRMPFIPSTPPKYPTRGQRPRNLNNNGILGSFVDLLFK